MSRSVRMPEIGEDKASKTQDRPETGAAGSEPAFSPSVAKTVYAGPAAYRLARELGIDLSQVTGSAADGRITRDDIKNHVRENHSKRQSHSLTPRPDFSGLSPINREPLSGVARVTAENMARAWDSIPHAWLQLKIDITRLETTRNEIRNRLESGSPPGLTIFILKALAKSLERFPRFNACLDEANRELVLKQEIHLGLAMDTPRGLLVPVIHHVDRLSLEQLAAELNQLREAGRNNRLQAAQLRGGGMTLSNLGGMKIDSLFPIVNWPEVAILGVGRVIVEPLWHQQQFVPRSKLNLVLGFDHRVINGADGARFLNYLKRLLEQPAFLALS